MSLPSAEPLDGEKGGPLPQVMRPTGQPSAPPPDYAPPPQFPGAYYQPPVTVQPMQVAPMATSNTTVIVQQAPQVIVQGERGWSSGLFSCFDDIGSCLCGLFCPTFYLSKIVSDLGESCCVPCCVPGAPVAMRVKIRTMYKIKGSMMDDCCMMTWCFQCMLCQMDRELKIMRR